MGDPARDHDASATPDDLEVRLAHAVVAAAVHCRRCGYDLRGLPARGRCPECGLPVVEAVRALVDAEASHLPQLRDARGVGNGLLWLLVCTVVAVLALLPLPWLERVDAVVLGMRVPADLPLLSAAAALAGLWSVLKLHPPRGEEQDARVRQSVGLIALALLCWASVATLLRFAPAVDPTLPGGAWTDPLRVRIVWALCLVSVVGLLGLGGVLRTIGSRSRAYRQSHAARQGVLAMVCAVAGIALGVGVLELLRSDPSSGWPLTVGRVIVIVSGFMAVIGLLYLLLNAWWIRTALCRPPPTLAEVVGPGA